MDFKGLKLEKVVRQGIDQFDVDGIRASQRYGVWEAFEALNEVENISRVIEFGTQFGGLTILLSKIFNCPVHTYEIDQTDYSEQFKNCLNIKVNNGCNIFNKSDDIGTLISSEGKTLVLCDNGDKIREFNLFSRFLKSGDIIMAHDYVKTKEEYEKNYRNKIWNWHEISYSPISESVGELSLKEYLPSIFSQYVWACFKKE